MEQLFISLCRGNLGLFMEIQMLLNNRCSSKKETFFSFLRGRGLFFFKCSLEKRAECLLQNIEELH